MRIQQQIKIGTTTNMMIRMSKLMIDEILATEPGSADLEKARHKQFAHLHVRGERFAMGEDLLSHIAMIREHFGPPKITKPPPWPRGPLPPDSGSLPDTGS